MKRLLLLLVCGPVMAADDISIANKTGSTPWSCGKLDANGVYTALSPHQQEYTAIEACLNRAKDGTAYRVRALMDREIVRIVVPAGSVGTAALSWTAPTQNTDGSPIAQPVTYKVYHGTAPAALTETIPVTALAYTFTALPAGTHYFAVTAVTVNGESAMSGIGSKVIP